MILLVVGSLLDKPFITMTTRRASDVQANVRPLKVLWEVCSQCQWRLVDIQLESGFFPWHVLLVWTVVVFPLVICVRGAVSSLLVVWCASPHRYKF